MQAANRSVEELYDIEAQKRADEAETVEDLVQHSGDTVNALVNHRYVSMALIAFLAGLVTRNVALTALTGFLLTVVTFGWLWSRRTLVDIFYQRKFHHTHVFPGETAEVEIVVENRKWLPVTWLEVNDTWPTQFAPSKMGVMVEDASDPNIGVLLNAYSLRSYERVRRRYELVAKRRGYYPLGPANITSGDPFSMFERTFVKDDRRNYLVVYPQLIPLQELGLPLHDPLGYQRVKRRLFEDPNRVIGVREHQPQDTFRDIHWKASAKTGQLHSKVYEPTRGMNVVFAVNIASFENYWRGFWPEMMEYTLSVAATLSNWTAEQNYTFGLICNGAFARADQPIRVAPGRRPTQLRRVLEALAGVKAFVSQEFGQYVLNESPRLPVGATIVMITPFVSDMIAVASKRLQHSGRQIVWVVLGKQAPQEIHHIPLYHAPIPQEEPEWSEEEFAATGLDVDERQRRLNARQRFLQEQSRAERVEN